MGMAALLTHCRQITDDVFLQAAKILAGLTPAKHLETGMLFPTIGEMKVVNCSDLLQSALAIFITCAFQKST